MQDVPESQKAVKNQLSRLQVLLDKNAQTAPLPPAKVKKLHRDPEYVMPVGTVKLVYDP